MHAKVDGHSDQHRRKRYRQYVKVAHDQSRETHGVPKPDDQTNCRFDRSTRLLVSVDENQGAEE